MCYEPNMKTWIALLRGINVGGNNILPMKDLRDLLAEFGYEDAATYIQSGNCVFRSVETDAPVIADNIGSAIEGGFGFRPHVFMLTPGTLNAALEANPFPQGVNDPKSVHLFFLAKSVNADLDALAKFSKENEAFSLTDEVFYLYAPDGIARSKLAENIGKFVPVPMTARNLRTSIKLAELAQAVDRPSE